MSEPGVTRPNVAVVIVNYRTAELALRSVRALAGERAALPGLRAIVVDGGSGDGSAEAIAAGLADPALAGWATPLPLPINGGFGWANNQAILRLMQGANPPDYIHLLNPDAEVEPGAVRLLADVLDTHPECGAVGSLLLDPDGTPSGSAFRFWTPGRELLRGSGTPALGRLLGIKPVLANDQVEVDWATGASVMLRAAALRQSGLFDDGFFLYFEEVELMWRIRAAGWTIRHEPRSRVVHVAGASTQVRYTKGPKLRPRLPAYWYAARRRFLALTQGRTKAALASAAWLAGHGLWTLRRLAGLGGNRTATEAEAADLLRHGVIPSREDLTPAPVAWNDPIDRTPTWLLRSRPPLSSREGISQT